MKKRELDKKTFKEIKMMPDERTAYDEVINDIRVIGMNDISSLKDKKLFDKKIKQLERMLE